MASTTIPIATVKGYLAKLGYFRGLINDDPLGDVFRADLRRFQSDYPKKAGRPDGVYGPRTESALAPLVPLIDGAPCQVGKMRRFRLTYYYFGSAQPGEVPMYNPKGDKIASVTAKSFVEAALEGTTILPAGRAANVARPAYNPIRKGDAAAFAQVYAIAKDNGWLPDRPGYAGIRISQDGRRATHARNFHQQDATQSEIWNIERKPLQPWACFPIRRIPLQPWRTLATDLGVMNRHDPTYRARGGVIPAGTKVFILEFLGAEMPDGSIHDGWFVANDTGGGIFGAHCDVFVGTKKLYRKGPRVPHRAHIWYRGIGSRIPLDYSYGL